MTEELTRLFGFMLIILSVVISMFVVDRKTINSVKGIISTAIIAALGFSMLIL